MKIYKNGFLKHRILKKNVEIRRLLEAMRLILYNSKN